MGMEKDIKKMLANGVVLVKFTKKDGTVRDLYCTNNREFFNYRNKLQGEDAEKLKQQDEKNGLVRAYDLQKNAFRSFKAESVISYEQFDGSIPEL